MNGYRIDFRPGWDCHGLPIELKALQENKRSSNDKDPIVVRKLGKILFKFFDKILICKFFFVYQQLVNLLLKL